MDALTLLFSLESKYTPFFFFLSLSLSPPLFLLLFFFLRILFFPLLLLQCGFYTFIIDDDFGLGLIKGSDFGQRKQNFDLGFSLLFFSIFIFLSLSSPSFFKFGLIIYMNLYMALMNDFVVCPCCCGGGCQYWVVVVVASGAGFL